MGRRTGRRYYEGGVDLPPNLLRPPPARPPGGGKGESGSLVIRPPRALRRGSNCVAAEGPMTADKHFKRKVRERSRRTGESYTAALRHLRRDIRESAMQHHPVQWQRVEKSDFGYAAQVPHDWEERPGW